MKVLAFANGHALAHVSRIIEVCQELKKKCVCQISIAGHGKFINIAKDHGLQTYELPYVKEELVNNVLVNKKYKKIFPVKEVKKYIEADIKLCQQLSPDIILSDNRITARTVGDLLGIPVYTIMNTHISPFMKSPYVDWSTKFYFLPKKVTNILNHFQFKAESFYMDKMFFHGLKKFRKEKNLETLKGFGHESGHVTLIPDLPEFNPPSKTPSSVTFTGPIMWQSKLKKPAFLKQLNKEKETIFISLGSLTHQGLLNRLTELGDFDYQFIIATGAKDAAIPANLPENIFIENFINMNLVLPYCDLMICHGGNGTIYQALNNGLPIIGFPKHDEQKYNVQLAVKSGFGLSISRRKTDQIDFKQLMKMANKILNDDLYKINAIKFMIKMKDYSGPAKAADTILAHAIPDLSNLQSNKTMASTA